MHLIVSHHKMIFIPLLAFINYVTGSTIASQCPQTPVDQISYLPYDDDLTKFWQCINGAKTLKSCPQYHHFDQVAQNCKNLNDLRTLEDSFSCDPNSVDFFPHPTDCSKYIWCYYGTAYVIDCEKGQWFSPTEKRCTAPISSGCTSTTSPPWTTPDNSICAEVPDDDIILKKCDCGCMYYWECRGKKQTLKECEFKLDFVEERQLCAGLVSCDDHTKTPYPWTSTFPPTTASRPDYNDPRCYEYDDVYFPHPDCTKFTHCEIGWGRVWNCPYGLYFDAVDLKCGPSNASCFIFSTMTVPTTTTTNTPPFTGDPRCQSADTVGLFPYPEDCAKYVECYKGNSYVMSCPGNLWFSFEQQLCVDQNESDCFVSTTDIITTNENRNCRDLSFLPHRHDCRKFVECHEGLSFERTCPSGLHFDRHNERCTSPKSLKCNTTMEY